MFENLDLIRMAQSLASHSGARVGVIARNVANADTPGYRAQDMPDFASVYGEGGGEMRETRARHLGSFSSTMGDPILREAADGSPNGNSVSLETEMMKGIEARQSHDMAMAVYKSVNEILRTSLGRG